MGDVVESGLKRTLVSALAFVRAESDASATGGGGVKDSDAGEETGDAAGGGGVLAEKLSDGGGVNEIDGAGGGCVLGASGLPGKAGRFGRFI